MKLRRALLPLIAVLLIGNASTESVSLNYVLDASASQVRAKVAFFGIASKDATFPRMEGGVTIVPDHPNDALIDVTLDARALTAPDEVTLKRLKGKKFFWVQKYPEVHFVGTKLVMRDATHGEVDGKLTARGVTQTERLHVTFDQNPMTAPANQPITLTGEMEIDRRKYGMRSYRFIVGKKVKIMLTARMVPQAETQEPV